MGEEKIDLKSDSNYNISLSGLHVSFVMDSLKFLPYNVCVPVLLEIESQIKKQTSDATE